MKTDGAREEKSDNKCTKQSVLSDFWGGGAFSEAQLPFPVLSQLNLGEDGTRLPGAMLPTADLQSSSACWCRHADRTLGCFQWQMCLFEASTPATGSILSLMVRGATRVGTRSILGNRLRTVRVAHRRLHNLPPPLVG